MPTDAFRLLSQTLAALLAYGPPPRVYCALSQHAAPPQAQQFALPRIMVPLNGQNIFECSNRSASRQCNVQPHEAVFTAPMAWTRSQHGKQVRFFSLVCHEGFTRYLVFETDKRGAAIESSKHWIHTRRDTSTALRNGLLAVSSSARRKNATDDDLCLRHQIYSCLVLALDELIEDQLQETDDQHTQWREACAWIEEQCHRDIDRRDIAQLLAVHPNHIARIFRHCNDRFPARLEQSRMNRATALLSQSNASIDSIASSSGFQSTSYFIRRFKLHYGMTPAAYRQQH